VGKGTNFKFCTHSHGIDRNKSPLKMSGKLDGRSYAGSQGLSKIFRAPIIKIICYRAHRAVIFAIAWHLVVLPDLYFLVAAEILVSSVQYIINMQKPNIHY